MKELSIEEKAKRYDEALKVLHKYDGANIMFSQSLKEEMFPELAESEDERIRKALIWGMNALKDQKKETFAAISIDDCIAWLEKQCEKGINGKNKEIPFSEQKPNPCGNCGIATNNCQNFPCVIRDGEQKSTDKVEPKFKIGDIIKDTEDGEVFTIRTITKDKYIYTDDSFDWIKDQDEYELVEQKPADKVEPKFKVGDLIKLSKEPKYPAREIISIKNDGYYFDSAVYLPFKRQDDWELVGQKPAEWSEEEQQIIEDAASFILSCVNTAETKKEEERLEELADKLQDLRPQSIWKPSEEQIEALYTYIYNPQYFNSPDPRMELVESVYKDLKKLKDE